VVLELLLGDNVSTGYDKLCAIILKIETPSIYSQLSSPSNIPGIPTKSNGMPSSASVSMFSGCSRAKRDANPVEVYWLPSRPVPGMSKSFGGFGGGGKVFEYLILAI
jgi:hypothetical protein